ncbi:MAG TPA: NIPSNAP family protein [Candidatus Limnocylindrales bacterium]|jgi:hypothetical protein|nr:NIPSNAP family protein [Candidatus Limnocylindrales bacterium]
MQHAQLRIYRMEPGQLETFAREWREQIVPLRLKFGFTVVGGWTIREQDTFVWVVGHEDGAEAFAEADRAYRASPERSAMSPNPSRLILEQDVREMDAVAGA